MEREYPFVVVEGQNKSGKGTIANYIKEQLKYEGFPARVLREPGGTEVGERIRSILLDENLDRPPITNVLLFNAARAATVNEINRSLSTTAVVGDRSYLSTLAFQVHGEGANEAITRKVCEAAISEGYDPDAFIVLDIPFETYVARDRAMSEREEDYFEKGREFFNRVREGYIKEARLIGATVIDANRDIDIVKSDVWDVVKEVI